MSENQRITKLDTLARQYKTALDGGWYAPDCLGYKSLLRILVSLNDETSPFRSCQSILWGALEEVTIKETLSFNFCFQA